MHSILILFSLLGNVGAMTLCEYYAELGISKPECAGQTPFIMRDSVSLFTSPLNDAFRPSFTQFNAVPLCRNYFHSCMASDRCDSGTICSNGVGPGSCCTAPDRKRCPTVTAMGINCRKTRGVNWCNSDVECTGKSTMASMCCPTGCNYNMCVHVGFEQPPMSLFTRNLVFSSHMNPQSGETCPDPYLLNVKCIAHRTTSWCISDNECPQNSLHPRKCCTTVCGYNTCVVKYNGVWQIA